MQGDSRKKDFHDLNLDNLEAGLTAYLPTTGPLTAKDYKSRLASSEGTQTIFFPNSGVTIRCSWGRTTPHSQFT